jgi:hypothetical protein
LIEKSVFTDAGVQRQIGHRARELSSRAEALALMLCVADLFTQHCEIARHESFKCNGFFLCFVGQRPHLQCTFPLLFIRSIHNPSVSARSRTRAALSYNVLSLKLNYEDLSRAADLSSLRQRPGERSLSLVSVGEDSEFRFNPALPLQRLQTPVLEELDVPQLGMIKLPRQLLLGWIHPAR